MSDKLMIINGINILSLNKWIIIIFVIILSLIWDFALELLTQFINLCQFINFNANSTSLFNTARLEYVVDVAVSCNSLKNFQETQQFN